MKILFLTYHGFRSGGGISKKMRAQIKGLEFYGHEVHVCWYAEAEDHNWCRYVDNEIIQNYGKWKWASIKQRFQKKCIFDYCKRNNIEFVYARSYINSSPTIVCLFHEFKKNGIKSVIEIPTYPYDQEFKGLPIQHQIRLFIDKLFRKQVASQTDGIVTFSDEKTIFGQRTIRISNGVDFDTIPLHKNIDYSKELHLIAVAEVHFWHGLDRLIEGLGKYNQQGKGDVYPVYLHIVGEVWDTEMYDSKNATGFATHIKNYNLEKYVIFHGKLFGEELDSVFEQCSFAIGSLARHRSGITKIKTIKNREYAGRGFPFIYSENDSDFDHQPYIMKAPADESPIIIDQIISFLKNLRITPEYIRKSIEHLSWEKQMKIVLDSI